MYYFPTIVTTIENGKMNHKIIFPNPDLFPSNPDHIAAAKNTLTQLGEFTYTNNGNSESWDNFTQLTGLF